MTDDRLRLPRLCLCSDSCRTSYCPPECGRGWIEPHPRDEQGQPIPDSHWTPEELRVLNAVRAAA